MTKKLSKKSIAGKTKRKKTTNKKVNKKSLAELCFIMTPFTEPFNMYYEKIYKPAVINANLEPKRADNLFRPSPIVADIWSLIQEASVLLAELTTKNANVFYELGLAHAIGKPVVLISETMNDVPFDLRSLRVINYDKNQPSWGDELQYKITASLNEVIKKPIEAVPIIFRKIVKSQAPEENEISARISLLEKRTADLERKGIGLLKIEPANVDMPLFDTPLIKEHVRANIKNLGEQHTLFSTSSSDNKPKNNSFF